MNDGCIKCAEAQATIARQQVMLDRALEDAGTKMVEIARLREEVARLREALDPFAEAAEECDDYGFDDANQAPVTAGQCREARTTLEAKNG